MRQRFLAVLEERNRIAREIHDTIIQGCTSISAVLEAVSTISPAQTHWREDLVNRARVQARTTIEEARRSVWDLRQKVVPSGELGASMARMSSQITAEFGVPVHCTVRRQPLPTSKAAMHEVLMIVREALHNAALHGSASAIHLSVDFDDDALKVEIADDGRGFEPNALSSNGRRHYGIVGMRERAARLKGRLEINSSPGKGTQNENSYRGRSPSDESRHCRHH